MSEKVLHETISNMKMAIVECFKQADIFRKASSSNDQTNTLEQQLHRIERPKISPSKPY